VSDAENNHQLAAFFDGEKDPEIPDTHTITVRTSREFLDSIRTWVHGQA
jgi:hypothetical protein